MLSENSTLILFEMLSLPIVLLTAYPNLTNPQPSNIDEFLPQIVSVSKQFFIDEMSHKLFENQFDIKACFCQNSAWNGN